MTVWADRFTRGALPSSQGFSSGVDEISSRLGVVKGTSNGSENGRSVKQWLSLVAIGLLVLFVLVNTQEVEVNFLVTTTTIPLIFALLIAALLGALATWLLPRVRGRSE